MDFEIDDALRARIEALNDWIEQNGADPGTVGLVAIETIMYLKSVGLAPNEVHCVAKFMLDCMEYTCEKADKNAGRYPHKTKK